MNTDAEICVGREQRTEAELTSQSSDLLYLAQTSTHASSGSGVLHPTIRQFGPIDMEILQEEPEDETDLRQIFWRKPRIRQYLVRHTTLIREADERTTTWLELFFDLLFAGIVAILGAAYVGTDIHVTLGQFIMLFLMSIRPWFDYVMFYNVFASDDVVQKAFTAWIMALVVGLGVNCTNAVSTTNALFVVFYLLIRFSFAFTYVAYCPLFPQFRASLLQSAAPAFISSILFITSIFTPIVYTYILWCPGIAIDYLLSPLLILATRYLSWIPHPVHRLAINIEHMSERNGLFLIIVLGEVMVGLFYRSTSPLPDISYAKAVLAMLLGLNLAWIYFDLDGSRHEVHAMRRHAWTGIAWNLSHVPLFGAVVLAGVSVETMVSATDHIPSANSWAWLLSHWSRPPRPTRSP